MPRLFIGTFLPAAKCEQLAGLRDTNMGLDATWQRKLRWVGAERMHMTWLFMGSLGVELIQPIEDALQNITVRARRERKGQKSMRLVFDKAEIWPDSHRARVVVLTASSVDPAILQLARTIRTGLLEFCLEQQMEDPHPFKPHITLLRCERRQEQLTRVTKPPRAELGDISGLAGQLPIELELDRVALIESNLGKNASYEPLQEYLLVP